MKLHKPYSNKEYADLAVYCNKNDCHIEDKGDYLESISNEHPMPTPEEIKQQRIAELKAELSSTDYKIIKCSECSLVGEELPYDIAELHTQRQVIRDEINELESE